MERVADSKPGRSTDNEQAFNIYRSLAVTGAVVIPGFGIVRRIIDADTADPLWERLIIAAFLLGFVGLSMVYGPVRRNPHTAVAVVLYVVSAGVIHIAYVNGMTVNTSYGLLIMLFACSLAFRTRRMLAGYLLMAISGVGAILVLTPVLEIDPLFFLTTVVAVSMLTYAVQVNRLASESALRRARDMAEAAVAARSRFLANMSHEIRTPMNAVIGMASLLEDTDLSPTQRDYLRTIRTSGDALLMLINDILDFSKIEGNHVELEREPFDPVTCIEDAAELVSQSAREKGLELVCDIAPEIPAQLVGDSLRLRQVLVNLLSNAVKFTRRGEVHMRVDGAPEGGRGYRLHCAVRDTGIGIAATDADLLFEAFSQADSSTTRRFGGTGLGLSICKQLVERMSGSIQVTSKLQRGSTFEFDVLLGLAPGQTGPEATDPACRGMRMLIFEPNAAARAALARQLDGLGIRHEAVADEQAAREHLSRNDHDVVIAGCAAEVLVELERTGCGPEMPSAAFVRLAPMAETPAGSEAADGRWPVLYRPLRRQPLQRALLQRPSEADTPLPAAAPARAPEQARVAGAGGLRILLVEDNVVNQRVTLKMLGRLGHGADLAPNGRRAVEALSQRHYDVVLMDLQMPVMDGLEATRQIRAMPGGDAVRIIAMTANAMRSDREACIAAGMNDYLCKPVKLDGLDAVLAPLITARAFVSAAPDL